MNYLAHFLLSGTDQGIIAGNFAADQVDLHTARTLPSELQPGIALHRQIDMFTDSHHQVSACIDLARPLLRKYAPVAVDILFDYCLASSWSKWTDEPFDDFEQRIYDALLKYDDVLPPRTREHTRRMVSERWLPTYCTREGIEDVFRRTAYRARFSNQLIDAPLLLDTHFDALQHHFSLFWPELHQHCQKTLLFS
jgi:acyl carrier protein phosphodiesterase